MSSATLFLIQPRRNRYVLRLYNCIGTQRLTSGAGNFVVHGASCITGIDLHITLAPVSSQEPLQLGPRWRGKGRPQGVIGLGGGRTSP